MSSYEFWDELGKIFNAVVAYQDKNIEFNRRFINPWIRLGNVFDKQDRSNEAVSAYEKAIEIDPGNAQYWLDLGNIHFKMERYDKAVEAFNKAIELDPGSGWSYNNLALALVAQGKYEQAILLYQKGIELLTDDKDKAVAWNRLGNAYRRLNEYDLALEAFQKADELDRDNAGFRDTLDEVPQGPTLVQSRAEGSTEQPATLTISPIELIVAESRAEESAAQNPGVATADEIAAIPGRFETQQAPTLADVNTRESASPLEGAGAAGMDPSIDSDPAFAILAALGEGSDEAVHAAETELGIASVDQPPDSDPAFAILVGLEEGVHEAVNPAESELGVARVDQPLDSDPASAILAASEEGSNEANGPAETAAGVASADQPLDSDPAFAILAALEEGSDEANGPAEIAAGVPSVDQPMDSDPAFAVLAALEEGSHEAGAPASTEVAPTEAQEPAIEEAVAQQFAGAGGASAERELPETPEHGAYEEFLKDSDEPLSMYEPAPAEESASATEMASAGPEPVAEIDQTGEIKIEMDTKNAHAWNELGNVYFNTGAFDDAIVAYSKAIELDRWFAWPYSNLALAYVQKRRFVEAILLYQRSIELFTSEKDKAISWNRLGNVYRRLNDYENAIQAYQLADELDPDNTTLSLQSRFSLLGSYALDQKLSYVS